MEHKRREPAPGVLRVVLPLPFPGLDRVNAFLLRDESGDTLVDCGMRTPAPEHDHGFEHLTQALAAAGGSVDALTRLVVTHPHIDHYGLAAQVVDEAGCELWMHESTSADLEPLRDPESTVKQVEAMFADHGVPPGEIEGLTSYEDWRSFVTGVVEPTVTVKEGDTFECGGREWRFVHTPGHIGSHVCLWCEGDGLLISGDHLLPTITPHIDFKRGYEVDPLGDFLDSLAKVERLDPKLVLPGHGRPFEEGAERAKIVARHHDRRLGAISQIIRHEARSASEITEEIFGSTLLNFHRRLALGEALAHLVYLRKRGEIERLERDDGTYVFKKVRRQRPMEDDE